MLPQIMLDADAVGRGYYDCDVMYRSNSVPEHQPAKVRLSWPGFHVARQVADEVQQTKTFTPALMVCLPESLRSQEWLLSLSPISVRDLEDVAMALGFGIHWRTEVQRLLHSPGSFTNPANRPVVDFASGDSGHVEGSGRSQ